MAAMAAEFGELGAVRHARAERGTEAGGVAGAHGVEQPSVAGRAAGWRREMVWRGSKLGELADALGSRE